MKKLLIVLCLGFSFCALTPVELRYLKEMTTYYIYTKNTDNFNVVIGGTEEEKKQLVKEYIDSKKAMLQQQIMSAQQQIDNLDEQ